MSARRLTVLAAALVALPLATSGAVQINSASFTTRLIEARIESVTVKQAVISVGVAMQPVRDVTIRGISFSDSYVQNMPAWIPPVQGTWKLRAGEEFVLPVPVRVIVSTHDVVRFDDLETLLRRRAVAVRTSVELAFATPWPARLLLMGPTQTVVADLALDVPVYTGPSVVQPLAQLGAAILDTAQRGLDPAIAAGVNALPGRRALLERFGDIVGTVSTAFTIDSGRGAPAERRSRTLGFWWNATTFCTTRAALEPWRFDAADAAVLQVGGGRLRKDGIVTRVGAAGTRAAFELDPLETADRLRRMPDRRVHVPVDEVPRRIRIADRAAAANIACVRVAGDSGAPLHPVDNRSLDAVAAFSSGRTLGIIWTDVAKAGQRTMTLAVPVHASSFGSPLVSERGLTGMVLSSTTAADAEAMSEAAAHAVVVKVRPGTAAAAR